MRQLVVFTEPGDGTPTVRRDNGVVLASVPGTADGRPAYLVDLPDNTEEGWGATLIIDWAGTLLEQHGMLWNKERDGVALPRPEFVGDVFKKPAAPPPPVPPPVTGSTPLEVINAVYATGAYNLATKPGCGGFTEECCRQLALAFGQQWGHVAKSSGQNQYQNHAVDAVMALAGNDHGIWDIITSSVSSSARPAFNRAGDSKPELWRPPSPLPCVPAGAATRDVPVSVTLTLEQFLQLNALKAA